MSYRQLALGERYIIYALKQEGYSQQRIAACVGVHKSTISRELRRNIRLNGYRPAMAHRLAVARRLRCRKRSMLTPSVCNQLRVYCASPHPSATDWQN